MCDRYRSTEEADDVRSSRGRNTTTAATITAAPGIGTQYQIHVDGVFCWDNCATVWQESEIAGHLLPELPRRRSTRETQRKNTEDAPRAVLYEVRLIHPMLLLLQRDLRTHVLQSPPSMFSTVLWSGARVSSRISTAEVTTVLQCCVIITTSVSPE